MTIIVKIENRCGPLDKAVQITPQPTNPGEVGTILPAGASAEFTLYGGRSFLVEEISYKTEADS